MKSRLVSGTLTIALAASMLVLGTGPANAATTTADLTGPLAPLELAQALAGEGVSVSNVTYTGDERAAGTFAETDPTVFGFNSGVILSSGEVASIVGPNNADSTTTAFGGPGDTDLTTLSGFQTNDASVLSFDFVPNAATVYVSYVFASEEFNEYSNSLFNDTFAFFVNGQNCATVDNVPVSINTINGGNPLGTNSVRPQLYRNNDLSDGTPTIDTQADGLTVGLVCESAVNNGETNTMKLAIADGSDSSLDSWVLLSASGISTTKPEICNDAVDNDGDGLVDGTDPDCVVSGPATTTTAYTGSTTVQYSDSIGLSGVLTDTMADPDAPVSGKDLTFTLGTQSTTGSTGAAGTASGSITMSQSPGAYQVTTSFAGDAGFAASSDTDSVTVAKEDSTLTYSGETMVAPMASTTLSATLGELDSTLGDLSNKTVVFTVTDSNMVTQTFSATTNANGVASITVPLASGVYAVKAEFTGDNYYLGSATAADTLFTVQAAGAKVTGGGWTSISTGRTSFGFNVIPEATGFKGQFQLHAKADKAKFHGNTATSLVVSGNTATWTGSGKWNGTAGYTFQVSVVDNGSSGGKKGDTIKIVIKNPSGTVVFTTGSTPVALKGGNITIH
ncbi:choice-of-anchor L domain-containing protein [Cryobacterium gelidum]|uniref:Ig-like domain repeat protein n=1 Tax=Cryobacterium gelidum TaxID=1259164 RepID=A0A4R9AYI8_9MICO|nr:choice-of-anchor L domain-containing protein [Cryobacterium gelidum]TFD72735.1 hypothetical protein E3T50_05325 [Cryobacterium gelidum]